MVCGLSAGGSGIRTLGPAKMVRRFEATPVDLHLAASFRERRTYFVRGIDVSNPGPSSEESATNRSRRRRWNAASKRRDRWFESSSLQRRVSNEPRTDFEPDEI